MSDRVEQALLVMARAEQSTNADERTRFISSAYTYLAPATPSKSAPGGVRFSAVPVLNALNEMGCAPTADKQE